MTTTRDVFNRIAPGWYNFRHYSRFRRELERVARRWIGGRLLNVGAAHGPDFLPFAANFELVGIDDAAAMCRLGLKYAAKHGFTASLITADAASLPFRDGSFDRAVAVAVYHHLDSASGRTAAMRELYRVLRPGGEAFITVWNRRQPRFWLKGRDVLVPWRTGEETFSRYHHLFTYGELEALVRGAGFRVISSSPESAYRFPLKYFSRNICLHVSRD